MECLYAFLNIPYFAPSIKLSNTLILLHLIFCFCVLCLIHTYLLYPMGMQLWSSDLKPNPVYFELPEEWPYVSVIMAAYNEELVIGEKIQSLLALDYPSDRIYFFVGSDCSTDQTNSLLYAFAKNEKRLHFIPFTERQGKPGVVNQLCRVAFAKKEQSTDHILLMTDASVMLETDTLKKLIRHFKDPDMALVDSHILGTNLQKPGISHSENSYVSAEARLKNKEGQRWGTMIGPFGGCFALRSNYYVDVPTNFLVDDFYIAFKAMQQGGKAINDLEAICYEAISQDIKEEFRRKVRISTGNYQNLITFANVLKKPLQPLGFAFLSHKVLRWLGPFFILISFAIALFFSLHGSVWYQFILLVYLGILVVTPLLDAFLQKFNIHILPFRHVRYFVAMNRALLVGFFRFMKGVEKGIWEPTRREY
jgi:cellulose synthase/poly-beta-1,6-N-acetylglucosamine synthase-like glycosyltransferase